MSSETFEFMQKSRSSENKCFDTRINDIKEAYG